MTLGEARALFLDALANEHLSSPHTVALYGRVLLDLVSHIGDLPIASVSRDHLRRFLLHLRDVRGNAPSSLRTKTSVLRAFFRFLLDRRLLRSLRIHPEDFRVRVPRTLITVLTREELDRLLRAVQSAPSPHHRRPRGRAADADPRLRDTALLFLIAACGLRVGEAVAIDLAHVSTDRSAILVHGKGRHLREVYYDVEPLHTHLSRWILERRRIGILDGALFPNFRDGARLSTRAVQLSLDYYASHASIQKRISPHTLRHTFASLSIENGANAKAVAQILGHRNVRTTINTYTHLSESHVRDVFRICHPLGDARLPLEERLELRKRSLPLFC